MRTRLIPLLVALLSLTAFAPAQTPLTLDAHTAIVLSASEPGPIQEAAKDLAADMAQVFGTRPRILTTADPAAFTITIGQATNLPAALRPATLTGVESFSIASAPHTVVLSGADMRGTIYAIYQFSEQYLGTDPLAFWTGKLPPRHDRIDLPATLTQTFPSPVFHYRGIFTNDEDLLTGWAPAPDSAHTGISLDVWNKIYETILRLKGNMVVPGSWIFPDDAQIALAAKRGLIINQHHSTPLGVNAARWPKDVPYNYTTHPEILERAWKNAVNLYPPNAEVLWSVGLRGLSDVTYAAMDPSVANNDKALGDVIGRAIADEMRIVRAIHPDAKFVTDLWNEGIKLVQQGYLKLPPDAIQVWADNGYGFPQDKGQLKPGQGVYYHVAMMNSRSNQLTEMVPVDRIVRELGRYQQAGATQFLLLNTSDIRPVLMTAKSVLHIGWKGALPGGANAATQYYKQWATDEFGAKAAPALAQIYADYFAAPVHFGPEPLEYGDQIYHQESVQLMYLSMVDYQLYFVPGQAPRWDPPRNQGYPGKLPPKEWVHNTATHELQLCGEAQPRWDAVWQKALAAEPLVDPAARDFYHAQVLAMIAINRQSNRILTLVSQAILAAEKGQKAEARQALTQALTAFDDIQKAESAAEYGKWKNWYRGDWLTNIASTRQTVETYIKFIDDPIAHVPLPIFPRDWEAYYHIMHYEGDRTVDVK